MTRYREGKELGGCHEYGYEYFLLRFMSDMRDNRVHVLPGCGYGKRSRRRGRTESIEGGRVQTSLRR